MANIHIYVRVQARLSAADAQAVTELLDRARAVIEASGSEWQGGVTTQQDDDAGGATVSQDAPVEPPPPEPAAPDTRRGRRARIW